MTGLTRLLVMRHAKSDWASGAEDDFGRPLNARGMRDARLMGHWLAQSGQVPERILSSPARRTRQTLELMSEGAGINLLGRTDWHDDLYHASLTTLCAVLAKSVALTDLLLLGHNPGLEELVTSLLDGLVPLARHQKILPTGAVYVLELPRGFAGVQAGSARVLAHQRPQALVK